MLASRGDNASRLPSYNGPTKKWNGQAYKQRYVRLRFTQHTTIFTGNVQVRNEEEEEEEGDIGKGKEQKE